MGGGRSPVGLVEARLRRGQDHRQRQVLLGAGEQPGHGELAVGEQEGDQRRDHDRRRGDRQRDSPEGCPATGALDERRLLELLGDRPERRPHQPDAERHRERRVEDAERHRRAAEAGVVQHREGVLEREEQHEERRRDGDQRQEGAGQDPRQPEPRPREPEAGEGVGHRGAEDEADARGQTGHEQAVAEQAHEVERMDAAAPRRR